MLCQFLIVFNLIILFFMAIVVFKFFPIIKMIVKMKSGNNQRQIPIQSVYLNQKEEEEAPPFDDAIGSVAGKCETEGGQEGGQEGGKEGETGSSVTKRKQLVFEE